LKVKNNHGVTESTEENLAQSQRQPKKVTVHGDERKKGKATDKHG